MIMLISVLTGLACGAVNGFIITKLRVPEFIATLSTQYLFRSMVFVFAIRESGVISNKKIENPGILIMGGSINGLYLVTIAFVVLAVAGQFILKKQNLVHMCMQREQTENRRNCRESIRIRFAGSYLL